MSQRTSIAWVDSSFNPWIGCSHKSSACEHCYAESLNARWNMNGTGTWGPGTPRKITKGWSGPKTWNRKAAAGEVGKDGKRWLVFAGDLCDIFDDEGPAEARERTWKLVKECHHLTWLFLTKRADNLIKYLPADWGDGYPNAWLGVTIENNRELARRLPFLKSTPAAVRFVSFEPLLESLGDIDLTGVDWSIVGGESGTQTRPFALEWAREIQQACRMSGATFFMKQLGRRPTLKDQPFPILLRRPDGKRDVHGICKENMPSDLRIQHWPK
jgi:protein gp37